MLIVVVDSTLERSDLMKADGDDAPMASTAGLVVVFSAGLPQQLIFPFAGNEVELGRNDFSPKISDARISRQHVKVSLRDGRFFACDLGSRNGTSVDGIPVAANVLQPVERCLRIGDTLLLAVPDVRPIEQHGFIVQSDRVMGPRMNQVYLHIARVACISKVLHISGESGVGKEDAARAFHAKASQRLGAFIAVNCATIPESLAERLLFGAKRGAYSGANADADGYIQAANGGTLFLDEVAELNESVQAKLLRVLENSEVQALGAARPTPIDIRVCSASHASLRGQVAAGRLREDLYYRIGRPEITIPPLRHRLEEIPWLIALELSKVNKELHAHISFVESCLLRHWPGNVRELLLEVRAAGKDACSEGSLRVTEKHLNEQAGQPIKPMSNSRSTPSMVDQAINAFEKPPPPKDEPDSENDAISVGAPESWKRKELEDILRRTGGNVSRAARVLGMHRTSMRRLIERYEIEIQQIPDIIPASRRVSTAKNK